MSWQPCKIYVVIHVVNPFWSSNLIALSNVSHFMWPTCPQETYLTLPFLSHWLLMFLITRKAPEGKGYSASGTTTSNLLLRPFFPPLPKKKKKKPHKICTCVIKGLLCVLRKKKKNERKRKKPQYDSALYTAPIANLTSSIW